MKIIIQNDGGETIQEIGNKNVGGLLTKITKELIYIMEESLPIDDDLNELLNHYCD
jgi:hypothetical protein